MRRSSLTSGKIAILSVLVFSNVVVAGERFDRLMNLYKNGAKAPLTELATGQQFWAGKGVEQDDSTYGRAMAMYPIKDPVLGDALYAVALLDRNEETFLSMQKEFIIHNLKSWKTLISQEKYSALKNSADPLAKDLVFTSQNGHIYHALRKHVTEQGLPVWLDATWCYAELGRTCINNMTGHSFMSGQLIDLSYLWDNRLKTDVDSVDPLEFE